MMRMYPVQFAPRFGAWNSDLSRLKPGKGWDRPPVVLQGSNRYHALAVHEVGHFLAAIATGQLPQIDRVELITQLLGRVRKREFIYKDWHTLDFWANSAIYAKAGYIAEWLVKGDASRPWETSRDRAELDRCMNQAWNKCAQIQDVEQRQKAETLLQHFEANLDKMTIAHLKQYDRGVVEEMALRLMKDKVWYQKPPLNRNKLETIVREYNLENVPSLTQDTVPLKNQLEDLNEVQEK